MSRGIVGLDRLVTALIGLVLVAAGVLAIGWFYDWWSWLPDQVSSASALRTTGQVWWPWVLGAATVLLVLLGLRWLLAHSAGRRVSALQLPGSGSGGRLSVNASSAVSAACSELAARHDVRSAKGLVRRDRGQLVVDISATLEPRTDLTEVAEAADQAATALANSLERLDVHCRVRLDVARPAGSGTGGSSRVG
ncbi:MAG: hypothetical protein M3Q87_08355 [Actinomycetota bacterium]|nr:hypothetical protein [Actinomycetota bacterium]